MSERLENFGYKKTWQDIYIDEYEGYTSNMSDYHMHDYYELSLILSGDVTVFTPMISASGGGARLVLFAPRTSHYISCSESSLYKRINVVFSGDFVFDGIIECKEAFSVFKQGGNVITLTSEMAQRLFHVAKQLQSEKNRFRQKLVLLYLISLAAELGENWSYETVPAYISRAVDYISLHYAEKIVAADVAWNVNIGRTTLMNSFKRYTGLTFNKYLLRYRISNAIILLGEGKNEREVAELCGFGEASNMIRSFKSMLGHTPARYKKQSLNAIE